MCITQQYIINSVNPTDWDIIAIQELWLDRLSNARVSEYWHILYPSSCLLIDSAVLRSILLINTNISTDAYTQLPILSNDIMATRFSGEFGHLSLFNIYNNCTHNVSTIMLRSEFVTSTKNVRDSGQSSTNTSNTQQHSQQLS